MKNKILPIFALMLVIGFAIVVSAIDIKIDVSESFTYRDKISFNYEITSEVDQDVEYTAMIDCPGLMIPPLKRKGAFFKAGMPYSDSYSLGRIDDSYEPMDCKAVVSVLSPIAKIERKAFRIDVTEKEDYSVRTCADASCNEVKSIFILGETVFITTDSSSGVNARLLFGKDSRDIAIPTSIKADKAGHYQIILPAGANGKKAKMTDFQVIGQKIQPISEKNCKANNICGTGETWKNCPQDCKKDATKNINKSPEECVDCKNIFSKIWDFFKNLFS